ncbi:MAG: DMT family transporter [Candidatus Acidiferrales bacterium]
MPFSRRLKADLSLALICFFWGATFVIVKDALARSSVFLFMALRFSLAALLLGAINPRVFRGMRRADLRAGTVLGVLMFGGYAFQTVGLLFTTPTKSAFVTGFCVVLVPVFLACFWRRWPGGWVTAGVFSAIGGLYFLTVPAGHLSRLNIGDVLTLIGAALYALHIIFVGRYTREHALGVLAFLQVAVTAVFGTVGCLLCAATGWERLRFVADWRLAGAIVVTAVFATALAFTIQFWAQKYTTPTHAAILFTLEPVFAGLTSFVVLHERLGGRGALGAALVLAGILLAELRGPAQAAADSPGPVPGAESAG